MVFQTLYESLYSYEKFIVYVWHLFYWFMHLQVIANMITRGSAQK